MSVLTENDLKEIVSRQDGLSVSIYMPTEKMGSEVQENPIRWKNLVNQLEEQVRERGLSTPDTRALLEPLRSLEVDREWWQHQGRTLAVFLTPGWMRRFRLPVESNEILEVGKHYVVKPLLPLIQQNGRFFILVLDLNQSRFYQATRFSIEELELDEETPTSLEESTRRDDAEPQMQWRTIGTRSPGRESDAIFHGHGGLSDEAKTQILRFFQKLNDGLQGFYNDEQTPMVLAGVDYLIPLFRQASRYSGIIDEAITGSMKMMDPVELRKAAWQIVGPKFDQEREEALRLNRELSATG
ncbi:MAG TPA: hypothetical protein VFF68_01500, partial [Anaerolineaceae bacterium]|nr:hypothetical protein [Anaerolineaceae bacterium]